MLVFELPDISLFVSPTIQLVIEFSTETTVYTSKSPDTANTFVIDCDLIGKPVGNYPYSLLLTSGSYSMLIQYGVLTIYDK